MTGKSKATQRYPAFLDRGDGIYGIVFADVDGIVAVGETIDAALVNAEEALRDHAIDRRKAGKEIVPASNPEDVDVPTGATLVLVPLIMFSGKPVRANLQLDEDVLDFIDNEARRRSMTRTAYVNWMARRIAQTGG